MPEDILGQLDSLIRAKSKELAIEELKKEGKITTDGKLSAGGMS